MKRFLSLCLAVLMIAGTLPLIALGTSAEALPGNEPETESYPLWKLYVDDGLTVLLDGFDPENGTVTLPAAGGNGTWRSRVGSASATLKQPSGQSYWQKYAEGGVGYSLTYSQYQTVMGNAKSSTSDAAQVGLDLGIDNLPDGDYTFEMVWDAKGLVEDNGYTTATSDTAFVFHSFNFGFMKSWAFPVNCTGKDNQSRVLRFMPSAANISDFSTTFSDYSFNYQNNGQIGVKPSAPYAPQVINWTAVMDATVSGGVTTGIFTTYRNGAVALTVPLNNSDASHTYYGKSGTTAYNFFRVMYAYPGTVYSIRVYDRVLSSNERKINSGVDILSYYGVKIPDVGYYTKALGRLVAKAVSDFTFAFGADYAAEKAKVQSAADAVLDKWDGSPADSAYLALYEQNGLSMLFSAFCENPTVDLNGKTWQSVVSGATATVKAGNGYSYYTVNGEKMGIGYTASSASGNDGIFFDYENLPAEDFTFESLVMPFTCTSGSFSELTFAFGPMKGLGWPVTKDSTSAYTNNDVTWYYSPSNYEHHAYPTGSSVWIVDDVTFNTYRNKVVAFGLSLDKTAADNGFSALYRWYNNGAVTVTADIPAANTVENHIPTGNYRTFNAFRGYPSVVYAMRLYERVLTDAERSWNYAVDLMAYYRLDVSSLSALSLDALTANKAAISAAFSGYTASETNYDATRSALQELLDSTASLYCFADAESLVVQNGLTMWLSAFDPMDTSVNMASKTWTSRVGTGVASFVQPAGSSYWKSYTTGGVGYSLTFDQFKAVNGGGATNTSDVSGKVGLDLGTSNLPDGDYTLEMIWEAKGLVEADGKTSYSSGGAWTFYGFCIGFMKAWSFPVPNGTNNSQTYVVRWLPTSGGIGDYSHYFSDYALNNQSGGKQAVCSSVSYVPQIINYTLKMDVTDNGGTKTARFTSYRNGIAATKIAEGVYGTCQLDNANTYTTYYGNEGNSSPLFRLMYNYPGTVYSIRVYNRILTEEEAAQNHLSDVAACYRLNLSRYFNLTEEQKEAVLPLLADAVKDVPLTDANSSDYAAKRKAVKASIDALLTGNSMENLYVSKGLKALFRAFSSSDAYNLSTGTWTSVGGDVTATLAGGAKSDANPGGWYADVSSGYAKGIRYAQSATARKAGITLPYSLLPDGSYTIEAFVTPFGLEDGNGNAVYFSDSSQYGVSTQNGFIVGPLTSHVYPGLRSKTNNYLSGSSLSYCSHEIMFTYGNEGTYAWKLNDFSLYNHSVNTERKVSEGFTFTLTHDLKAASSSAYTVYDNGKESGSYNVSGASFVSKANAQNKTVDLFYGFPVTVYSVRVYDRVLSTEEQRQNHFADLAFYYGLDLSALFDLMGSDYQKALASLSDAFGDVSAEYGTDFAFGYEKAYALYCRIMEEETGTSPDSRTFYEKLYSNVGLAAHFDAMNADTADVAKHTWLSSVNASDVMTLQTFGSVDTFFKNGNGVGYTLSGSQSKSSSVYPQIGFNLPVSLIPEKSYTLEMLVRPVGTTQDGNPSLRSASKSDCQWLVYNAVAIGPLKSLFFTTAASGAENECFSSRWNYMAGEYSQTGFFQEYGLLTAFGKGNAHNGYLAANANLSLTADVINYSVTYTVNEGADKTVSGASYTFRSDANVTGTKTITAANYVPNSAVTSQNYFRLFYGLPATLYSVRLYDRPLSESERLQNHFADLVSYFHMGSIEENWNNLTEAERKEIYEKCEKITVNDSAKDVNSVLFSYFYTSGLYVTDGLTALFSAFAGQDENINVKTGVWKSSVGNATATLSGNGWSYNGKTQGLGYYRHFDGFTDYAYVSLPVSLISGSAFTVEVFADVTGIREDNGGRYGGDEYLNRSFNGAYVIGNLKANLSVTPVDKNGGYNSSWTLGGTALPVSTPSFTAMSDGARGFGVSKNGNVFTFSDGPSVTQTGYSASEFTLFKGNPATVYAIRVYNRVLSDAEKKQNHFADLAFYYNLDISGVLALDESEQSALFGRFASIDANTYTPEEMGAILDFYLGNPETIVALALTYDGLSARLIGDYGGIRSLYVANHKLIAILEAEGYAVAYGSMMAAETGNNEVSSARSLSVSGDFETGYAPVTAKTALVTVYGTPGKAKSWTANEQYNFAANGLKQYAYTLVLDEETNVRQYMELELCFAGFLTLTDGMGNQQIFYVRAEGSTFGTAASMYGVSTSIGEIAEYYVNRYVGQNSDMYRFWSSPLLNSVMTVCEKGVTRTVKDEAALLSQRLSELNDAVAFNKTVTVKTAGTGSDGQPHIWLKYLPGRDPTSYQNVKAAYIYYPMTEDPDTLTEAQMAEKGVTRTFCYIGFPDNYSSAGANSLEGIVCVHGGGGHAYAKYAKEAANYGYVALAMDTEGYHALSARNDANEKDALGHLSKDGWANAEEKLEKQWMYYAVSDVMYANTIIRSFDKVDAGKVGMTGISWGGVITSCVIGLDDRMAFAVPVYCGYDLINDAAGLSINAFAAALWQPAGRMKACKVPTLVLTSQKDMWASLNNSQTFYEYLGENGYITIKTDFSHSQEAGQAAHEIYYFGHFINSGKSSSYAPITFKETATGKNTVETSMGRQYTLELTVPAYLDLNHGWSVALNYVTAPLTYVSNPAGTGGSVPSETWTVVTFTPYENGGKWYVDVEIPADAYLYQISFRGYNAALASHSPVGGNNIFQGYMWNSTDVVVLGGGSILAE